MEKITVTIDRDEYKTLIQNFRKTLAESVNEDEETDEEWLERLESYTQKFVDELDPDDCYESYDVELDECDVSFILRLMIYNTESMFLLKENNRLKDILCEKVKAQNEILKEMNSTLAKAS